MLCLCLDKLTSNEWWNNRLGGEALRVFPFLIRTRWDQPLVKNLSSTGKCWISQLTRAVATCNWWQFNTDAFQSLNNANGIESHAWQCLLKLCIDSFCLDFETLQLFICMQRTCREAGGVWCVAEGLNVKMEWVEDLYRRLSSYHNTWCQWEHSSVCSLKFSCQLSK